MYIYTYIYIYIYIYILYTELYHSFILIWNICSGLCGVQIDDIYHISSNYWLQHLFNFEALLKPYLILKHLLEGSTHGNKCIGNKYFSKLCDFHFPNDSEYKNINIKYKNMHIKHKNIFRNNIVSWYIVCIGVFN